MVAFTLMEFNRTVITGTVVSADTVVVMASQMEVADKQTVSVEHLQQQRKCLHILDTDTTQCVGFVTGSASCHSQAYYFKHGV